MKNILLPLLALALVVGFGIYETLTINNLYEDFESKIDTLIDMSYAETLTVETYESFCDDWIKLREKSEFFLPHSDMYEMSLRISETKAYVEQKDFELCIAQLSVMKGLSSYISHLAIPSLQHIM